MLKLLSPADHVNASVNVAPRGISNKLWRMDSNPNILWGKDAKMLCNVASAVSRSFPGAEGKHDPWNSWEILSEFCLLVLRFSHNG